MKLRVHIFFVTAFVSSGSVFVCCVAGLALASDVSSGFQINILVLMTMTKTRTMMRTTTMMRMRTTTTLTAWMKWMTAWMTQVMQWKRSTSEHTSPYGAKIDMLKDATWRACCC